MDSVSANETGILGDFEEEQLSFAASEGWVLEIINGDCHSGPGFLPDHGLGAPGTGKIHAAKPVFKSIRQREFQSIAKQAI